MASQGPLYPASVGTLSVAPESANDWRNPANAGADDAVVADIVAATYDANDISYRLVPFNFGFTIPTGATIDGIVVEIDRRASAGAAVDYLAQLAKGTGSADIVGTNKASAAAWPAALAIATYGGAADLWGATWTPAEINNNALATAFAVVLSVKATAANTDIGVDFIRATVYYTVVADTSLAGSSAGVSADAGALTTQIALGGSVAGASTTAGALAVPLAGSSSGASALSGGLTTSVKMAGDVPAVATTAGALATSIGLAGAVAGLSSIGVSLSTGVLLAGSASPSASALAVALVSLPQGPAALVGTIGGQASLLAALNQRYVIAARRVAWPAAAYPLIFGDTPEIDRHLT